MRISPARGLTHLAGSMPIALKVPLLMSAILVAVMSTALATTFTTLRSSALERARERLVRATRQLAIEGSNGFALAHERYAAAAQDTRVRQALRGAAVDARPALLRLSEAAGSDTSTALELWSSEGRRIALVGRDVAPVMVLQRDRPFPEHLVRAVRYGSPAPDSVAITPLYLDGENAHFWYVMPVRAGRTLLGYIAHQRRITPTVRAQGTLRGLSGDSVTVYYRNAAGSAWSKRENLTSPLIDVDYTAGTARAANGERVVFDEARLGSSPIIVGLSISERALLARQNQLLGPMVAFSAALLAAGAFAAWLIGRRVARPLARITRAAESLAAGDYSARVPAEGDPEVRQLAESFNHMAAEIDAARRALQQQTREARTANSAKSEFLTTMSHELRTPLNAIGGYVDLLDMELRGPLTAAQKRDLHRIKASQQHLLGLISGVLDLARVESGKLSYDMVNVAVDPFLAGLDALIEPQAAAKNVRLEYERCPQDLAVVADREKLRQILLNLLSNAIRHTPAGGRVTLSAEQLGSRARIAVEDTGPGIPPERQEEIFEPFVQLDRSLTQTRDGLGLGLAISRDLARGMAGDLSVDPHTGGGARFVLTLNRGTVDERSFAMTGETEVIR